jgi:hypothetical protein
VIAQIAPSSRKTLLRLCCLFFFDSLASGMVPNSLIAFYISRKFSLPEGKLGSIIGSAQFLSSIGNVSASAIAQRIGLVKTMVFTHATGRGLGHDRRQRCGALRSLSSTQSVITKRLTANGVQIQWRKSKFEAFKPDPDQTPNQNKGSS